ncbi:MAG: Brp/Blh family beta-carotene 15,15'-dioxygenase [Haloarculaceae archaeon]
MSVEDSLSIGRAVLGRTTDPGIGVSRAALAVVTVLAGVASLAGVDPSLRTQAGIYLFGMVALNLPHGGYEHFNNLRRRVNDFRWRYVGAYLFGVGAFLGLFFVAPAAGLALAIAVACLKGGHGGLHVMDATYGTPHLDTRFQRLLAIAVRGGVVMLVPMYFHTGTFATFSAYMVSIFDPAAFAPVAAHVGVTRHLAVGGWGALAVAHVALGSLRGGGRSWRLDALETGLLGAYFAVVPVVIAVGLYFPLWYSARQVARHVRVDREPGEGSDVLAGDSPTGVALKAWGMLVAGAVATGTVVSAIWFAAPDPLGGASLLPGLVAFWSVTISIIALPHVVVGSWADTDRGIWYVP